MKLNRVNIEAMRVGINEEQLVQSFKDALRITRCLGYKYLWIDSLCIIQDDEADWRKESSKMVGEPGSKYFLFGLNEALLLNHALGVVTTKISQ